MLRGNKNTRPGLAIVEVIMVMAISGVLFVIAIGVFNSRKGIGADDAARQVMSEIARVRNDAQQGLGATTGATIINSCLLEGKEIFGQAIQFRFSGMDVYKLAQSRTLPYDICIYEQYHIAMPYQFNWDNATTYTIGSYGSSYGNPAASLSTIPLPSDGSRVTLVFRNGTGQSYAFRADVGGIGDASSIDNYTSDRQGDLKMAFYLGSTRSTATKQFYANFTLAIPNDQLLEVVK